MIEDIKPYPAYKDSGVTWLGEVPEHWDVRRLRDSTEGCIGGIWGNEPDGRNDLPCVRVADFDRQRLRIRLRRPTLRAIAISERRRRLLLRGDLLLEKSGGGDQQPVGVVVLYDHDIPAVCSNFVARIPVSAAFSSGFLAYLHSHLYAIRLNLRSIKQTTGIQNLDSSAYLSEPVAFPTFREQCAIFRFLDHADRRIRRYIHIKKKLIVLLNEQKQAIIQRAVTRGLDPNVRLKPSGIEWLGEVPEHWDLKRIHGVFQERNQKGRPELPILVVSIAQGVTAASEVGEEGRPRRLIEDRALYKVASKGDIAYNMMRMWQGAAGVVPEDGLVSPAYVVARPYEGMNAAYYTLLFRIDACKGDIVSRSRGIVDDRNRLYWDSFKALRVPVPPPVEQDRIVNAITAEAQAMERSAAVIRGEISLLQEYRTRLIADVVTGKLDVREAAARLPEETEEPEPLDESEAMGEDEAEGGGGDLDALPEEATA